MTGPTTVAQVVELLDEYVFFASDEFREIREKLGELALKIIALEETIRGLEQRNRGGKGSA